jgi:ATP-binding cassette subfamily B protein
MTAAEETALQLASDTAQGAVPAAASASALPALVAAARRQGLGLSVDELRHEHGLADDAALTAGQLLEVAVKAGLEGRRVELGWADLLKLGDTLPVILRLKDGRFVVLAGAHDGTSPPVVLLQDPVLAASEPVPIDEARLAGAWDGEAILLRRRHELGAENRPFGFVWLLARMAEDAATFRDVALATAVTSLFALVPPMVYMTVIDRVLVHQRPATLAALALFVGFVLLFDTSFGWLRRRLIAVATARLDGRIGLWLFDRLLALPLDVFERTPTGVIVHKLGEVRRIRSFLTGQMFGTLLDGSTLFVLVPAMFFLSPTLAWLVLGLVFLMCLVVVGFMPPMSRAYGRVMRSEHRRNSFLVETVHGMRTVKALAIESTKRREWDGHTAEWVRATTSLQLLANLPQTILAPLEKAIYAASLLAGSWLVMGEHATLQAGTLVAFTMIATRVTQPLVQIAGMLQQFQEIRGALTQVASIVDLPAERSRSGVRAPIRGGIELVDLRYRYPNAATPALDGIDLRIEPGSMVGIMGRSGSGKSTLTRLLQGFQHDYEGLIRIDGVEMRELDLAHLRRHLGVVLQDSFLFQGTIRDNILAGRTAFGLERVVEAARLAGADEFIERLPRGYDTMIEEGGGNLSGGQRQRLAIARAILPSPPILILDEATSALDPDSEAIVNANLRRLARDRTMLVVSHRLTSLVDCDQILVLERGRLAAVGRHEDLLHRHEPYRRLWQQQLAGSRNLEPARVAHAS